MREIVLISSWRRADYLEETLKALRNARGVEDKDIWVFQNCRQDDGVDLVPVLEVLYKYALQFPRFRIYSHDYPDGEYYGWMYSQWEAWKRVWESGAPYAYFLSDDDVVTPDFFEWHEAVHADGDWFGSTAWRNPQGQTKPHDLAAYYQIEFPNEITKGFCAKRDSIKIMLQSWPDWCPQARMISEKWKIVMPYVQRLYHIGARSSQLASVGENHGPAIDVLPNPIPDYGRQKVVLRP
jgi:GT2 family glycosyltransferase